MKRPNKNDEMFWLPVEDIDGGTQQKFNHALYDKWLESYCDELESKLNKHDVSNRREQLIAFFDYLNKQDNITNMYTDKYMYIDKYLESN